MLLTGGPRDLPLNHQTMHDIIAWNYDLSDPNEQAPFRRLVSMTGKAGVVRNGKAGKTGALAQDHPSREDDHRYNVRGYTIGKQSTESIAATTRGGWTDDGGNSV